MRHEIRPTNEEKLIKAEVAIMDAIDVVKSSGVDDARLVDAVSLLRLAQDKVADIINEKLPENTR